MTKELWEKERADPTCCIVSIDKDMDMIPGWHYNQNKGELYFVTPEEADYFFHKQLLTGDRVDNIIGIKGIGDKKSDKALGNLSYDDRVLKIQGIYKSEFGDNWLQRYEENKQLLWILREER